MKIGITCYPSYGGSGVVGAELGLELARRGHEVHFISYAPPIRLGNDLNGQERIAFHSVDMLSYPLFEYPPYTLALASRLCQIATERMLDVLHMHYAIPHAVSAYLAREMSLSSRYLPFVTTLHGTDITLVGKDPSFLPITRFGIERSDAVTAISEYLRIATYETLKIDSPIEVIYNFIDAEYYRQIPDRELRRELAPRDERLLLHVSTFRPVKRIGDCVRILAGLRAAGEQVRLVMCGEGPERSEAEALADREGVRDHVSFVGKQPQSRIRDLMSIADLLLLPSETESFGLVALEAMACQLPVVATNVGGIPEVITDGECGYLFDVGDVDRMAQVAADLLNRDEERRRLGENGRSRALAMFTAEGIIPRYESLYKRVVEHGHRYNR